MAEIQKLDPLNDPRWHAFVASHPDATVFHSIPWIKALRRTYGYEPAVFTHAAPGELLRDGVLGCAVSSWITGERWVSLPFSDHCDVLTAPGLDETALLETLGHQLQDSKQRYLELRPRKGGFQRHDEGWSRQFYWHHVLDLRSPLEELFKGFHKDSTQRKIKRAQRERLVYKEGRSEELLQAFFRLFLKTRRRHRVPPQSFGWFQNLVECFGDSLKIRVTFQGDRPTAAIITLQHFKELVYKYGASDEELNPLGGTHLLFWEAIQDAKRLGLESLDFGRSDRAAEGLITFKSRWGATQHDLVYTRLLLNSARQGDYSMESNDWRRRAIERVVPLLPDLALGALGKFIYPHIG